MHLLMLFVISSVCTASLLSACVLCLCLLALLLLHCHSVAAVRQSAFTHIATLAVLCVAGLSC